MMGAIHWQLFGWRPTSPASFVFRTRLLVDWTVIGTGTHFHWNLTHIALPVDSWIVEQHSL